MQDRVLLSLTQVTDDSTGIWTVGELDYSIHVGDLDEYLKKDPIQARDRIFAMLGVIMVQVNYYAFEEISKRQGQASCPPA